MPCRGTARLAQEGHQQLLQLAATPTKRQAPQKALVWKVLKNHLGQGWPKPRPFLWPLFTLVRGSGILGSPYPESCIAPVLTGQDRLTRTPCWTGAIHRLWYW